MLLAQSFIHFRPSPSYEKYFKFLVGIMTTAIFVVPLLELLQKDTLGEYQQRVAYHMSLLQQRSEKQLLTQGSDTLESTAMRSPTGSYLAASEEEIKTRLNNYATEKGMTVKAVKLIYEDSKATATTLQTEPEHLQESLRLVITLGTDSKENRIQIQRIKGITIDRIGTEAKTENYIGNDTEEHTEKYTEECKEESTEKYVADIRKELAALLKMDEEKLEVRLDE